ncbi:MAG: hypothetical protein RJP95_04800 [Pirellulales bacterium]
MEQIEQAFTLALDDLYEADAARQIAQRFIDKHHVLARKTLEVQQVWGFLEQGVLWKFALALQRLTQPASKDRASLPGIIKMIDRASVRGHIFSDYASIDRAKMAMDDPDLETTRVALRTARDAFIGHTLIGKHRRGTPIIDLFEYIGKLSGIIDDLHYGVFGIYPDIDGHIANWDGYTRAWVDQVLPESEDEC